VVIGGAFGKIVSSLVADIIMPLVGALLGNVDFTKLAITLRQEVLDAAGEVVKPAVNLTYGNFIQAAVDFCIIALCIFFVLKGINKLNKKKEEPAPAPAEPVVPEDIQLLREIRDELKKK
jgi:large conductance mechanosensitive channel